MTNTSQRILICGASGLIGTELTQRLSASHQVSVLGRTLEKLKNKLPAATTHHTWNEITPDFVANFDIIINLTGENIGKIRWTKAIKQRVISSRVDATRKITTACVAAGTNSPKIFNASAVGAYGIKDSIEDQIKTVFNEETSLPKPPIDFLSDVCSRWESELEPAIAANINVVKLRFGVVLSRKGAVLGKLLPSFKLGLGSINGTGKQPFPWISLQDAVSAIEFLINNTTSSGPYNIVANDLINQRQLAEAIASYCHRPLFLRLPTTIVKTLFGEMGDELLLNGQAVKPMRLLEAGFEFRDSTISKYFDRISTSP